MTVNYANTAVAQRSIAGTGRRTIIRAALFGLALLVLFWLSVLPLLMVVMVSFRSGSPLELGPFTVANYVLTYSYLLTYKTLLNSLVYSGISVVIVMTVAIMCALPIERTGRPSRSLACATMPVPLRRPPFLPAVGWIL